MGQWYQARLAEIIRVVESDESRRFAGEIETLAGHLKPIRSEARIYDLLKKGFFGRAWLFDAVEQWRSASPSPLNGERAGVRGDSSSRLFWITGDPGVGKSAFAAQLTHTRSDAVIAAQFVEWDKPDHRDARRVIRSLAFQLATRLPDYRKLLLTLPEIAELDRKDPAELFDYLLANPLRSVIGGGRERQLIVIDALDEAGEAERNPLVEMLARHAPRLPDWLGLVVTSRPESAVKTPLQGLNPFVLDTRTEANRADLRDYLQQKLAQQLHDSPDGDRLLGQILEKSEGVFLYVERFCEDVQQNHLSLDRPDQFPQGLGGIFCQWFQRQFPDLEKFRKDVRPALRAILAAREPLPVKILQRLFHWQDEELRDFTRTLGSLFPVTKEANGEVIKPYHKSLADWLADAGKAGPFFASSIEGESFLVDWAWHQFCHEPKSLPRYFQRNLPVHLRHLAKETELSALLSHPKYLSGLFLADASYVQKAINARLFKRLPNRNPISLLRVQLRSLSFWRRPKLFVSYSRGDLESVKAIEDYLCAVGLNPWLDVNSLGAGNWSHQIGQALRGADFVLAVFSAQFLAGICHNQSWIRQEVLEALNLRKFVIPLLIEDTGFARTQLSRELACLRDFQQIDLVSQPLVEGMNDLIALLK